MRKIIRKLIKMTLIGAVLGVFVAVGILLSASAYKTTQIVLALRASRVHEPTPRKHGYPLHLEAIERTRESVVLISNEQFGSTTRGTGVLVDPFHVLTCAHMVGGEDDLWIFPYPAKDVHNATPVAVDGKHDLAVLELDRPVERGAYAVFADSASLGEPITVIGNMLGSMRWFVTYGTISGFFEGFYLSDALIHGGNSGGPWIDEDGRIVALSDWSLESMSGGDLGVRGGVPAPTISRFLDQWRKELIKRAIKNMEKEGNA